MVDTEVFIIFFSFDTEVFKPTWASRVWATISRPIWLEQREGEVERVEIKEIMVVQEKVLGLG